MGVGRDGFFQCGMVNVRMNEYLMWE